jgi:hypothetical protein
MKAAIPVGAITAADRPSHEEIAHCARELWTVSGQPEGRDDAIWLEAESRLLSARQVPGVTAVSLATLAQPVARSNAVAIASRRILRRCLDELQALYAEAVSILNDLLISHSVEAVRELCARFHIIQEYFVMRYNLAKARGTSARWYVGTA